MSFPPVDFGLLAWVALAPLLWSIRDQPPRQAFRLGFVAGATGFFLVLSWIRAYGLPAWVLLTAYLALQFAVFAGLYRWVAEGRPAVVAMLVAPLLWTSLEFLRSTGPVGFPWALLGLTQYGILPVIQIARAVGVFGVSFIVALGSQLVLSLLQKRLLAAALPALLIAAVLGWGTQQVEPAPVAVTPVAALQPNINPKAKFDPSHAREINTVLEQLVRRAAAQGPKLVIFPETALPVNLFGPDGVLPEVGRWAHEARATLVASSLENGTSNTAVAVAPSGQATDRYDKVRLVAFGEVGIQPGTQYKPLWTPEGRIGVAICFESIFPDVARALTRNGAEVLAVITNDAVIAAGSPVDGWAGPRQHAAHAVFRAVETGRWVVRAANTGQTMIIDPAGRVRASIPAGRPGVLAAQVVLQRTVTPYVRWGDAFSLMALALLLFVGAPRLRPAVVAAARSPAARRGVVVTVLPASAVLALARAGMPWMWMPVMAVFIVLFTLTRDPRPTGVSTHGFGRALVAGTTVVAGLWIVMAAAYRAQQIPVGWLPPSLDLLTVLSVISIAAVIELWLRSVVFEALADWQGTAAAIGVTTLAGMLLQTGLSAEAIAWALLTGLAFGAIRARTGNTLGLIIPHALGTLLVGSVFVVR